MSRSELKITCSSHSNNGLENKAAPLYDLQDEICRICHMGSTVSASFREVLRESAAFGNVQRSDDSLTSQSITFFEPLIATCKCRGTVGLVHVGCLERWLTESGHTKCEICGHKYVTRLIPRQSFFRSVVAWIGMALATRQMLMEFLYLAVSTPLALFSCYICAVGSRLVLEAGFHEVPWTIVAMLPTCCLTVLAYWTWLLTLARLHALRWRHYWRTNFVVRLLPENLCSIRSSEHPSTVTAPATTSTNENDEDQEEEEEEDNEATFLQQ
ncbi:E3 ubiquitin-protein ligase MARCHF2-like [Prorops nasuta]|uniref:E3 ubiquitin-protein ligase MARCHF2-like n=1 Tax=Prorops nasuta TaxID=863751 RepID=UPI0034CDB019